MSYYTQSLLVQDEALVLRAAACAAVEQIPNPVTWAYGHAWQLSAQPGWDAAYAYAINTGSETPGRDGDVITDGMILAAVQAIRVEEES